MNYISSTQVAGSIPFDNSTNGFTSNNVQSAIEEATTHLTNSEANGTTDITTTATSDVLMTGLTLTPTSGDYLVWFSTSVSSSANGAVIRMSVWAAGAQITHSERRTMPYIVGLVVGNQTTEQALATHCKVTVNGSQAIEGRWRASNGTSTAHQRTLNILRLS